MKPALGRNLGALMGRDAKPNPDAPKEAPPATPGAGVRSLMQGTRPTPVAEPPQPTAPSRETNVSVQPAEAPMQAAEVRILIPSWYFFGLDLLLLILALGVAWPNPALLSWKGQLVCAGLVVGGAISSIFGVMRVAPKA